MKFRNGYNYDADSVSLASGLFCPDETLAQQHMRDECDINQMVKRYAATGMPPPPSEWPTDADFDEIFDFQSAMNVIAKGREAFNQLPSAARERFQNNPALFLEFVGDHNNLAEAESLGLVPRGTYERTIEQKLEQQRNKNNNNNNNLDNPPKQEEN